MQLLGLEGRISISARNALDDVESRIKRTLPASVREWYELKMLSNSCFCTAMQTPQSTLGSYYSNWLKYRWRGENDG
jgi:hypothetical protein